MPLGVVVLSLLRSASILVHDETTSRDVRAIISLNKNEHVQRSETPVLPRCLKGKHVLYPNAIRRILVTILCLCIRLLPLILVSAET